MTGLLRLPRGIRNHNPGNIRHSKARWRGLSALQPDQDFVSFISPEFGIRALMRVLLTYQAKHKLQTVHALIHRWAPPIENNSMAYAEAVARALGVSVEAKIDLGQEDILIKMARAIIRHENGRAPRGYPRDWYQDEIYQRAFKLL